MDDKFKKLMSAKSGKKMHPLDKKAKLAAITDLHEQAKKAMGEKLSGIKKVSVMADDKEGLEEGLEKAKELLEGEESEESEESSEDEKEESAEEQVMEAEEGSEMHPEMAMDAIEEKIAKLMEMKKRMLEASK